MTRGYDHGYLMPKITGIESRDGGRITHLACGHEWYTRIVDGFDIDRRVREYRHLYKKPLYIGTRAKCYEKHGEKEEKKHEI
jgi:hypothetical protein